MFWLLFSGAISIAVFSPNVGACSVSYGSLSAFYAPVEGIWKVQLAWSSDNPTCLISLEELVPGGDVFQLSDNQTCTPGRYCYFTTSMQTCKAGKPQYTILKLVSQCSRCNFATFSFTTADISNVLRSSYSCRRVILPGCSSPVNSTNMEYEICGQDITCFEIGSNVGPGCYCEEGYSLNKTTGRCVPLYSCPPVGQSGVNDVILNLSGNNQVLNLTVSQSVTLNDSVIIRWIVQQERKYKILVRNSLDEVVKSKTIVAEANHSREFTMGGRIGELTLPTGTLSADNYSVEVYYSEVDHFLLKAESQHGSLRFAYLLSDDKSSGALQVYLKDFNSWSLICSDGHTWDAEDTEVACRQLGYQDKGFFNLSNNSIYSNLSLAGRTEQILDFARLNCSGNESMLLECPSDVKYEKECNHDKIVQISCYSRTVPDVPSSTLPTIQPTSTDQSKIIIVMAVLIAVFIGCIVLMTVIFLCWRRRQKKLFGIPIQEFSLQQATTIAGRQSFSFLPQQADKWELARSDFQLESKIGSGNFGTVFKGMLSLTANSVTIRTFKDHMMVQGKSVQSVAIKVLKDTSSKECLETFLTEIDTMKRVSEGNNAHVVKMVGCITMSVPLALVLEFVSQGNLRDYLRSAGNAQCEDSVKHEDNDGNSDGLDTISSVDICSITEQNAEQNAHPDMDVNQHHDSNNDSDEVQKAEDDLDQESIPVLRDQRTEEDGDCDVAESDLTSFAYQLADGMQYLSSLGVLHRDLACRNILVDESKVLKIADFGLARNTEEYVSSMKDKLPLRWMSPETFHTGTFSEKSDVWSYGVCLWEIFSMGSLPFKGLQNVAIVPQILAGYRLQKPKKCPDHIYSIMTQCWNDKPEERPTFTTLHSKFEDLVSSGVALEYLRLDSGQKDCNL